VTTFEELENSSDFFDALSREASKIDIALTLDEFICQGLVARGYELLASVHGGGDVVE
jgi:hypothetical protein